MLCINFKWGMSMINILKEKRLEKGMTLEEVGNLVGVGKSTVRKWENGMIENMGRDKIIKLSNALSISPLAILGIEEPSQESDQKSNYKIILSNNFKKYRLKKGLSIEQLVDQLNNNYSDSQLFTVDQIKNYEKGFTEPSLSIAKYLADFYEIKIQDFFS